MAHNLHIHLHDSLRARAQAGEVPLFTHLAASLPGWRLHFQPDTPLARLKTRLRGGYGLFHMQPLPAGGRILCLRRAYIYPFWRIERTHLRWEFDAARMAFEPASFDPDPAARFVARWRPKLLGDRPITRAGFILIPLQGHLQTARSFQSMSPLHMIEETLTRDPRPVIATLHPNQRYSDADRRALAQMTERFPRFSLSPKTSADLLAACDLVVTQNSSVALTGFFAAKPAILFGQSDFHHIAASIPRDGLEAAFARPAPTLDVFDRYLHWFFTQTAINAGAPDAPARLNARLRALGWPAPTVP
ncbi:MAG: hypothetical protein ACK4HW_07680 [Roseinatronobacter sp.]